MSARRIGGSGARHAAAAVLALLGLALFVLGTNTTGRGTLVVAAERAGGPDVRLSPDTLSFGPLFPQASQSRTLTVHNDGNASLVVGEITTNLANVTLGAQTPEIPPGTVIPAGENRTLTVTFLGTSPGTVFGTVTVPTNDTDEPEASSTIRGETVPPPGIEVSPSAFSETLDADVVVMRDLTIRNTGSSPLDWSLAILPGIVGAPSARGIDLTGVKILWDRTHGQTNTSSWTTIAGNLTAAGATIDQITGPVGTINASLLGGYQLLWSIDLTTDWTAPERNAVAGWVAAGGSVLLMGDNLTSIGKFNTLLSSIGAGFQFSTVAATQQSVTTAIEAHATTTGVDRLYLGVGVRTLGNVTSPAQVLVRENTGGIIGAVAHVGAGRVIGLSDELFDDVAIQEAQAVAAKNLLFGRQVVEWLAADLWLSAETTSGSAVAGDSSVVALTFDTANLAGGSFDATVRVTSNVPSAPTVHVPVHIDVVGVPDIRVVPSSVNFGTVLVGGIGIDTLTVHNDGFEPLTVSSIVAADARFGVALTSFTVAADSSQDVAVTFSPDSVGTRNSNLTITSDDPDESPYLVPVSGTGLLNCDAPCVSPWIRPADIQGSNGAVFALDIKIDQNPSPIGAFGFSITYDPCYVAFADSAETGDLTETFVAITAAEDSVPGFVRVGGFGTTPIPAGSSGVIARVIFTVTNACVTDSTFDFIVGSLADDVAILNPCCGEFRLTECPTGDGDVNADGMLTPQDALCALKIFVAGQNVPNDPDCDVNGSCEVSAADTDCGGMVTPADALAIFERFLAEGAPQPCFHQTARETGGGAIAWGASEQTEAGEWIATIDATSARAAGFDVTWDADDLAFVRAQRGALAEEAPAFEAREVAPGRLRCGFFEPDGLTGEVVRLVFLPLGDGGEVRIESVIDVALDGEARLATNVPFDLSEGIRSVSPNPSRGSVTIAFAVRDAPRARLRVLDVRGREVTSLVPRVSGRSELSWDGRDHVRRPVASGVYFVELTTGTAVFREKIVLVR